MNSGDNQGGNSTGAVHDRRTRQHRRTGLFCLGCLAIGAVIGFLARGWL